MHYVRISGHTSSRLTAKSGISQGSILGLVLFITYVKDHIPCVLHSSLNTFKDDFQCQKEFIAQQDDFYLQ